MKQVERGERTRSVEAGKDAVGALEGGDEMGSLIGVNDVTFLLDLAKRDGRALAEMKDYIEDIPKPQRWYVPEKKKKEEPVQKEERRKGKRGRKPKVRPVEEAE